MDKLLAGSGSERERVDKISDDQNLATAAQGSLGWSH